mmetsp:Transcript_25483/g.29961  ORF Transcript_25483/g.29961 Transcript_25483/m.29961 type:complete len:114 (+) Transcript_25483:2605-2946(+)
MVELKCDNGHGLYVTRWTKKDSANCSKCKSAIKYKDQMVTCPNKSCETTFCMRCSGCVNGHVVHTRVLNEPLPARADSCLRCLRSLQKDLSVKWCSECSTAYCAEGCDIRRID